jgi:hypothetical protein
MHATTLSFRAGDDFAEQTRSLANFMGVAEFLARETRTGATPFQQPTATGAPE